VLVGATQGVALGCHMAPRWGATAGISTLHHPGLGLSKQDPYKKSAPERAMPQKTKPLTPSLLALLLCAATPNLHAVGPHSFGQSNQQSGRLKVSRFDYDARDRAKQAGIAFDANDNTSKAANGTRYTYNAANRIAGMSRRLYLWGCYRWH
jgi:hypothetical protein